jgi:hypothetical protein
MKLPTRFDHDGLLPPGDYELTIEELMGSMLVEGPHPTPIHWDTRWRRRLVLNLVVLVNQLWSVGIENIFIDGSFVEEKDHPNDIDGYFECDIRNYKKIIKQLNELDPRRLWTWPAQGGHPMMWDCYRIELYPHYGQGCGIDSVTGYPLQFPAAFRQTREFQIKGIVKLVKDKEVIL